MSPDPAAFARRVARLYSRRRRSALRTLATASSGEPLPELATYKHDPVGFCRDVLGVTLTPDQEEIIRCLPGRVKVNSGHGIGKSYLAAVATVWWFYTRPNAVIVTTAPKQQHVETVLWAEIRLLIARAKRPLPDYLQPKAPKLWDHPDHWAEGMTASKGEAFQGRHRESMLFIFDECEALAPMYWLTTDTMYQPGQDHGWLAIGNPITTSSQSAVEDRATNANGTPKWKIVTLSALNHPNILAELKGEKPPIPNAVSLAQVQQWFGEWADKIATTDKRAGDVEWPPSSGVWYRPSPSMKGRVLGIRPVEGVDTVFGQHAWDEAIRPKYTPEWVWLHRCGIIIGVDVATYGDDSTVIHIRSGPLSLHHESHNGWGPHRISDRLKELCVEWAAWYNAQTVGGLERPPLQPSQVQVVIELDGPGFAVLDNCMQNGKMFGHWTGIKVAEASDEFDQQGTPKYYNKRSELWHSAATRAAKSEMDLSRLPQEVLKRLRDQLMTPSYELLPAGTIKVESKDDIKERLRRSPDDADSLIVCYSDVSGWSPTVLFKQEDRR